MRDDIDVLVHEVGPRDGLQSIQTIFPTEGKMEWIKREAAAGVPQIQVGSFVPSRNLPQMADSAEVFADLTPAPGVQYEALVPNLRGFERALAAGVKNILIFGAASESFSQKNINCSIAESFDRFAPVCEAAKASGIRVRGAVSCVLGCPYEGEISVDVIADVAAKLYQMGCYEIALGETIGTGTPLKAKRMVEAVAKYVPVENLAAHFHDTYGQALANLYAVLEEGVAVVDSSISGLGGCPYAKGATGNVATEDVLYMLNGLGIETGVDLDGLVDVSKFISDALGREIGSRAGLAILRKRS